MAALAGVVDHFLPPEAVRGMKVLSRDLFERRVVVPALIIPPQQCSDCVQRFKSVLLRQTGVKRFLDASEGGEVRMSPTHLHHSFLAQLLLARLQCAATCMGCGAKLSVV